MSLVTEQQIPSKIPHYEIVPLGKYAREGRPSYAHVYADGVLVHSENGQRCVALCEEWLDRNDPFRMAVKSGLLTEIHLCHIWPEKCPYACRADVVCFKRDRIDLAPGKQWYFCEGLR